MIKFITSKVNRKLTAMCILLAVMICIGSCLSGFFLYRNATYKTYNSFAYEVGNMAMTYVDTDKITTYLGEEYYNKDTGEFTPDTEYETMAEAIYRIYKNTSMHTYNAGIYICIPEKTDDGQYLLTNLFDVRIIDADADKKQYYQLGVVDPMGVANPEEVMTIFTTGNQSEDYFVHESSFGYNSTAILPVKNSMGDTVALLMADMPMPFISETLRTFLLSTVLITIGVVALFIGGFIALVQRRITNPIELISGEADKYTESEAEVSEKLTTITQTDEIGHLAKSIYKMENDIRSYIQNLTAVTAEKERIGAELDVATNIQRSMLPCIFPAFPQIKEIDIYATMQPAKEVGGDFYDYFMVDSTHVAMVAADVSGKGVPAALFMVIGKTLIKDHTPMNDDLGAVFTEVNNLLCEANEEGLFITAFEGVLDLVTGEFRYVNAGHETPFISSKGEDFKPYKVKAGFVLAGMEGIKYKAGSMMIEEGTRIFQYTDGVTEATNSKNELFGMDRLEKSLNENKNKDLQGLITGVQEDIDEFVGEAPQFDDITMICLEFIEKMKAEDKDKQ